MFPFLSLIELGESKNIRFSLTKMHVFLSDTIHTGLVWVCVDHRAAFGKAGEGRANSERMIQSIKIPARLAPTGEK